MAHSWFGDPVAAAQAVATFALCRLFLILVLTVATLWLPLLFTVLFVLVDIAFALVFIAYQSPPPSTTLLTIAGIVDFVFTAIGVYLFVTLSERERRALGEIAYHLSADDPAFARELRAPIPTRRRVGVVIGCGMLLLGLAMLISGVIVRDQTVLITGLVLMMLPRVPSTSHATSGSRALPVKIGLASENEQFYQARPPERRVP